MTAATETRPVSTTDHTYIANEILRQIGFWNRGCLDMGKDKVFAIEKGLLAQGVIVGPRKRGNIQITINSSDLYDIKVTRMTRSKGFEVLYDLTDVYVDDMVALLEGFWK